MNVVKLTSVNKTFTGVFICKDFIDGLVDIEKLLWQL